VVTNFRGRARSLVPTKTGVALGLALVCLAAGARAEPHGWQWLPGATRVVRLADGASRDAPVLEYAFGPSGQISLGHALGLATRRGEASDLHLGVSGLVALEAATAGMVLPGELARVIGTLDVAWTFHDALGRGTPLEVGVSYGVERAFELVAAESERVDLAPDPDDIPFGAGGMWLGLELATRAPLSACATLDVTLAERVYTNAWPLMFGARAESIQVASYLGEGLAHRPSLALALRWRVTEGLHPIARVSAELLVPHDDSADLGWLVRGVVGVAIVGERGELVPFVSLDAGNGKGLLVVERALRLSVGVRHAFP